MKIFFVIFGLLFLVFSLSGCGYNKIQDLDEEVGVKYSKMLSAYKKKQDLIPNLVEVVKGYAKHEKDVFTEITESRAKVGQLKLPENATQEDFDKFLEAQKAFSGSLSRLLAVSENYPNLKADQNFLSLQKELSDIETQITASRNGYIRTIGDYNKHIRHFPVNITAKIFEYDLKPQIDLKESEVTEPVKIKFWST